MAFIFVENLPGDVQSEPILISGIDSLNFTRRQYLIYHQNDKQKTCFEIRYNYHCSPFKEAFLLDTILAVGFEGYFYLYDLTTQKNIFKLELEGYFGNINIEADFFYVTDSCGLYCIDKSPAVVWQNNNLGIDGVIINTFEDDKIFGSGEWDPPGGWRDFILYKGTGKYCYKNNLVINEFDSINQ